MTNLDVDRVVGELGYQAQSASGGTAVRRRFIGRPYRPAVYVNRVYKRRHRRRREDRESGHGGERSRRELLRWWRTIEVGATGCCKTRGRRVERDGGQGDGTMLFGLLHIERRNDHLRDHCLYCLEVLISRRARRCGRKWSGATWHKPGRRLVQPAYQVLVKRRDVRVWVWDAPKL